MIDNIFVCIIKCYLHISKGQVDNDCIGFHGHICHYLSHSTAAHLFTLYSLFWGDETDGNGFSRGEIMTMGTHPFTFAGMISHKKINSWP